MKFKLSIFLFFISLVLTSQNTVSIDYSELDLDSNSLLEELKLTFPSLIGELEKNFLSKVISKLEVEIGEDTEFSGALLRRLRESAEASLADLAEVTSDFEHVDAEADRGDG